MDIDSKKFLSVGLFGFSLMYVAYKFSLELAIALVFIIFSGIYLYNTINHQN